MTFRLRPIARLAAPVVGTAIVIAAVSGQVRPIDDAGCTNAECHDDLTRSRNVHGPVAFATCSVCHQSVDGEHAFRLARRPADLCSTCHPEIDRRTHVHDDLSPKGCMLCHDPHGGDYPALLATDDVSALCRQCHGDILHARDRLHTPVAARDCTTCHDPHVATSSVPATDRTAACLACHVELDAALAAGTAHAPLVTGSCDQCHDPHGSDLTANLVNDVPSLCYECHEATQAHVEAAPVGHAPATDRGGCTQCHDPHVSRYGALLRRDPASLCGTCHDASVDAEGRRVEPVTRMIESHAFLHGPVQQRDCGACHDPHGADHAGLLVARLTPEFYAPFDAAEFELCFICHDARIVLDPRTTDITDFRNGDHNLHHAHVNHPEKGRTCRACHATHGSDMPHHVRESVPYGNWSLPVGYETTANGGRCNSGCHAPRAYDRRVPVAEVAGAGAGAAEAPPPPGATGGNGGLP